MLSFFRKVIDKTFPSGPAHEPKEDGFYANWRNAVGEIFELIREDIKSLKFIRDASHTPVLEDLEREYGRVANQNLTEDERRELLEADSFKKRTNATDQDLQSLLDKQGYNLTVYNNSPDGPAIDPALLLDQDFQMQALNGTNYYAGNVDAFAKRTGGELLVNGDDTIYPVPATADNWPFVFFIAGDAIFDPVTGEILTVERGQIPSTQRQQFETLVLKFKPLYSWCGVIADYT